MLLIWVVKFQLSNGQFITFNDCSYGNSIEKIKAVLDIIFIDFEYREKAVLIGFEYIVRYVN